MERKERIDAIKDDPSLRSRNDGILASAEHIDSCTRWLDIDVDKLIQAFDISPFRAASEWEKN